jgi:hypothetical protein
MKHVPRSLVRNAPVLAAVGLVVFAFGFLLFTGDYQDDGVVGWAVRSIKDPSRTAWSCADTDGGTNYELKGTVTFVRRQLDGGWSERISDDKCYNSQFVTEYYCQGKNMGSIRHRCETGCSDGACR